LAQVRQEKLPAADLSRQIELEVRRAFENLRLAARDIETSQETVRLAGDELAHARKRYKAGLIPGIEIVEAQNRLSGSHDDRLATQYRRGQAIVELAVAMGICDMLFR